MNDYHQPPEPGNAPATELDMQIAIEQMRRQCQP